MLATARCAVLVGVDAVPVRVEADVTRRGLPKIQIVGLVETAVRESQERTRRALFNCGYKLPKGRITVSLAPADMPKGGSGFDLSIALAMLAGAEMIPAEELEKYLTLGELSLTGKLQPVRGALSYALCERKRKAGRLILPESIAAQAAAVPGVEVMGAPDLPAVVSFLRGEGELSRPKARLESTSNKTTGNVLDLKDVRGQGLARRALEVTAAGGHNLLAIGPPGTGKSMLASRLPSILPPLTLEESLETSAIWSVAGMLDTSLSLVSERPLRAPHHTASDAGLIGGGSNPRPGELSLAHNGVLFLDELPEFRRGVLEALRQPLEQGIVVLSRAAQRVTFQAQVQLVATMNPCPCGMLGDEYRGSCSCSAAQVMRYRSRLSGPLLDRIDLHVEVPAQPLELLEEVPLGESSATVRQRVMAARERQLRRFAGSSIRSNAEMPPTAIREHCQLNQRSMELLTRANEQLHLSARGYDRVRKVARTIADLQGKSSITESALAEAISYRALDRDSAWSSVLPARTLKKSQGAA